MQKDHRWAFDSLVMLVCWLIWKERNTRVLDNLSHNASQLVLGSSLGCFYFGSFVCSVSRAFLVMYSSAAKPLLSHVL
jgi:hypothetical protein